MNTPLLTFVALVACYGEAEAQSGLTIYGGVSSGINYQSNQPTGGVDKHGKALVGDLWSIDGNVWRTSMLGVKGSEDLGGGLKVSFVLESGFDSSTGRLNDTSALWTRRSWLGLSGGFGTFKVGRDINLPADVIWYLDSGQQQAMGTWNLVKGRGWPIYTNQITYITPVIAGFSTEVAYGLGEAASSTKKGSTGGIALVYKQARYELRAMYDFAYDANGQYSSLFQYSKELTLGGTATFDKLKLYAGYQKLSAPAVSASQGNPDKAYHVWLGTNYQVNSSLVLIGGAYYVNLNQHSGSAKLFTLGANYSLSKRTLLYASIGTVRNGAQTNFPVEAGGVGVTGQNQNAFYSGVNFSF